MGDRPRPRRRRVRVDAPAAGHSASTTPAPEALAAVSARAHDAFGNRVVSAALAPVGEARPGEDRAARAPSVASSMHAVVGDALGHAAAHPGEAHGPLSSNRAMQQVLRKAASAQVPVAPSLRRSAGAPLPAVHRERFEAAMGHDLGHVRVHTDGEAAAAARSLAAHAFSLGADVYFGPGAFAPGTPQGDRLLAHELTHVVQHDAGRVAATDGPAVSAPSDPLEQEATAAEGAVLHALGEDPAGGPLAVVPERRDGGVVAGLDGVAQRYTGRGTASASRRRRRRAPLTPAQALAKNRALELPLDFIRRLRVALLRESLASQGNTVKMDAALTAAIARLQVAHATDADAGRRDDFAFTGGASTRGRPLRDLNGAIDAHTFRLLEALPGMAFQLLGDHLPGADGRGATLVPAGASVEARWLFYRALIRKRGGIFLEEPGQVNLLSIRGATRKQDGSITQSDSAARFKTAYAARASRRNPTGADPTGTGTPGASAARGSAHFSGKQGFDDLVITIWVERQGTRRVPRVSERAGSVDPAGAASATKGAAHLMDGQYVQTLRTHGTSGPGHQVGVLSQIFGERTTAHTARAARRARWRASRLRATLLRTATAAYRPVRLAHFTAGLRGAAKARVTRMWRLLKPEYKVDDGRLRVNYTALREARKVLYARQAGDRSRSLGKGRTKAKRYLAHPVINVHSGGVDGAGRDFVSSWGCTNLKAKDFPAFLREIGAASNARRGGGSVGIPYTVVDASKVPRMSEADVTRRDPRFGSATEPVTPSGTSTQPATPSGAGTSTQPATPSGAGTSAGPTATTATQDGPAPATRARGTTDEARAAGGDAAPGRRDATGGVGAALLDVVEAHGGDTAQQPAQRTRGGAKARSEAFDPATDPSTRSGVTVAVYARYRSHDVEDRHGRSVKRSDAREFMNQARAYARRHRGVAPGPKYGRAIEVVSDADVVAQVNAVAASLAALARRRGLPSDAPWTKVKNLAVFSHGFEDGLTTKDYNSMKSDRGRGPRLGANKALHADDVGAFARAIAGSVASDVRVHLFACNTGRDIAKRDRDGRAASTAWENSYAATKGRHGQGSFAAKLAKALGNRASVYAHGTAAPATDNVASKVFGADGGAGAGAVHLFAKMFPPARVAAVARELDPGLDQLGRAARKARLEQVRRWLFDHYKASVRTDHYRTRGRNRERWYTTAAGGGFGAEMFHDPERVARMLTAGFRERIRVGGLAVRACLADRRAWLAKRPALKAHRALVASTSPDHVAAALSDTVQELLSRALATNGGLAEMWGFGDRKRPKDTKAALAAAVAELAKRARGKRGRRILLARMKQRLATAGAPGAVRTVPARASTTAPPTADGAEAVLATLEQATSRLAALRVDAEERRAPAPVREGLVRAGAEVHEARSRLAEARRVAPAEAADALGRARAVLHGPVREAEAAHEAWSASLTRDPTADTVAPAVAKRARTPVPPLTGRRLAAAVRYNARRPLTAAQWELVHATIGAAKASAPSEATATALHAWQHAHGSAADGWLGPRTWRNLVLVHLGAKTSTGGWETTVPRPGKAAKPVTAEVRAAVAAIATARRGVGDARIRRVHRTRKGKKRHVGYVYFARYDMAGTADYRRWLAGAKPSGADLDDPLTRARWALWEDTSKGEGDPSAMNTWDDQDVTLGAGFSAAGQLQQVLHAFFRRAPSAMRRFYEAGILLDGSRFLVVDTASSVRLVGDAAEKHIRYDPSLIRLFVTLAQSTDTDDGLGGTQSGGATLRQHMLDAQFEVFAKKAGRIPAFALKWSRTARAVVGHANHWLPGIYPWKAFAKTGGDLTRIAAVFGHRYVAWRGRVVARKNAKRPAGTPAAEAPEAAPARLYGQLHRWGGASMRAALPKAEAVGTLDPDRHVYLSTGKPGRYVVLPRP